MRRVFLALLLSLALCAPAQAARGGLPDIRHVWIVVLENKDYADSFGPDTEARAIGTDVFNRAAPAAPPTPAAKFVAARRGSIVAGVRLRGRLLTFRARRSARIRIEFRVRGGKIARRVSRRVTACRRYHLTAPKGVRSATIRGAGRAQRVRRTPPGEHG